MISRHLILGVVQPVQRILILLFCSSLVGVLPGADLNESATNFPDKSNDVLAAGSWARGRRIFNGNLAKCSTCHRLHGTGVAVGPDLSDLVDANYEQVLRDISLPEFEVAKQYLIHEVTLENDTPLSGILRISGDDLLVIDRTGKRSSAKKKTVQKIVPTTKSFMPPDLLQGLKSQEIQDLMTYLLSAAPHMPNLAPNGPIRRSRQEVAEILADANELSNPLRPLNIVLVAGPKDHGLGEHDYPAWQKVWYELLASAQDVRVSTAVNWPSEEQFENADLVILYQKGTWDDRRAKDVDAFLARGGGLVLIHWAIGGGNRAAGLARRIGMAAGIAIGYRHGPLDLTFDGAHAITRNFEAVRFYDESYWHLDGEGTDVTRLATGIEENQPQPLIWCREHEKGRVFVSILGHYSWTFDDPLFRTLLLRGIAWTAKEPVDRFNDLVTIGVQLKE